MNYEVEYDRWLNKGIDDFEDEIIGVCEHCDEVIYHSERHVSNTEEKIHEDCFMDFSMKVGNYKLVNEYQYRGEDDV